MSILARQLSGFWLQGIAQIPSGADLSFEEWFVSGAYQVTTPLQRKSFSFQTFKPREFLTVLATEANKFGIGAIETWRNVSHLPTLPKSRGWTIIKCYYSGFYAANFILALFGLLIVRFDAPSVQRIATLGTLTGGVQAVKPEKGFYIAKYDSAFGKVEFSKIGGTGGGAHEQLWRAFSDLVTDVIKALYAAQPVTQERQATAVKLSELLINLRYQNTAQAAWLSKMRNEVNYAQRFGVWFPYKDFRAMYPELVDVTDLYREEPLQIELDRPGIGIVERFFKSAAFLTATCLRMSEEVSLGIAKGQSFVDFGVLAFQKLQR